MPKMSTMQRLEWINKYTSYHDVDKFYEESQEERNERRVSDLMKEFDENPNLLSQLTIELRKRKLQKIKKL